MSKNFRKLYKLILNFLDNKEKYCDLRKYNLQNGSKYEEYNKNTKNYYNNLFEETFNQLISNLNKLPANKTRTKIDDFKDALKKVFPDILNLNKNNVKLRTNWKNQINNSGSAQLEEVNNSNNNNNNEEIESILTKLSIYVFKTYKKVNNPILDKIRIVLKEFDKTTNKNSNVTNNINKSEIHEFFDELFQITEMYLQTYNGKYSKYLEKIRDILIRNEN